MRQHTPGRALIIGVASYLNIRSLPVAVRNDVADLRATLIAPEICGLDPAKVTLLVDTEATRSAVVAAIDRHAANLADGEPFLLYFSGHGERDERDESFLLTHEADPARLRDTAISDAELLKGLQSIKSDRQVIILDACHAGAIGTLKSGTPLPSGLSEKSLSLLIRGRGRVILSSCRSNEKSAIIHGDRNSVFTASLLRGIAGGAKSKDDGTIRIFDLFDFVAQDVPKFAAQHPVFKADGLESNFPLFRTQVATNAKDIITIAGTPTATEISDLLANLFPTGPRHDDVWLRAGGDLSRISLGGHGRAQWFSAITTVVQGGGGLSLRALLEIAARDFPDNDQLKQMSARLHT
ncbi:caspase family protein [Agrobacterium tumefaciens]|uniref:caspase family protein n=1 Tax=Agrobacterium tumefaciens TaxID=358 RepID=UPI00277D432F|nr:caspase family protein [Agrobacterium tumefaciens]MDP9789001.1 hypothetical protein [Agrobacterium tumefaciens]